MKKKTDRLFFNTTTEDVRSIDGKVTFNLPSLSGKTLAEIEVVVDEHLAYLREDLMAIIKKYAVPAN